jgi:cell division protein ZapE
VTPTERYQADLSKDDFKTDPAQEQTIAQIQTLYDKLITPPPEQGLIDRLFKQDTPHINGIYLWGGVGRGKTYLVDNFVDCLPFENKRRVHFHRFMQEIHDELQKLPKSPDPLQIVARRVADKVRVLCLDEFHVNDIADAMLLYGFLKALFENGVTLVTTSNIPPDELYKNGLQRERFVPAIELIKQHTNVTKLGGDIDFRLEYLEKSGTYQITEDGGKFLSEHFSSLAPDPDVSSTELIINQRQIETIAVSDDVLWLSFKAICETPRSAADYIEISRLFHSILVADIPVMTEAHDDIAQRFVHLIDALYDHGVKLIMTAASKPHDLYIGKRHYAAFQRTASRLEEMSSEAYLGRAHRA